MISARFLRLTLVVCLAFVSAQAEKYLGCFIDKPDRDLNGYFESSGNQTPHNCIGLCLSKGFKFAGVQYSRQCFCGNSYGKYKSVAESECNMACSGNSGLMCGGTWRMNIYSTGTYLGCFKDKSDRDLNGYYESSGNQTPHNCLDLCSSKGLKFAGVQYGGQCFCGNSYGKYKSVAESECNMACSGNSDFICGGTWRMNIYSTETYLGCFIDDTNRDLNGYYESSGKQTPRNCIALCSSKGYKFAGVQYSGQCFCGNSHGKYGSVAQSQCNMACSGNSGLMCGGTWRMNIYSTETYLGCFVDETDHDLSGYAEYSYNQTPDDCITVCSNKGYKFAGVQYGGLCFCGNSHGKYGSVEQSQCNVPCSGYSGLTCGGSWRMNIFSTGNIYEAQ